MSIEVSGPAELSEADARLTHVINDPDGITAALRGTALEGLPVEKGPSGALLVTDIGGLTILDAWRAARGTLGRTGRWPVMTTPDDWWKSPEPHEIVYLDAAARTIDPWPVFQNWVDDDPLGAERIPMFVHDLPGYDLKRQAALELPPSTTWPGLDRWMYERVLADETLTTLGHTYVEGYVGTKTWYNPAEAQLALLPTASPWLVPAWLSYFGDAGEPGTLSAALWQWHEAWGAELVASWGTMLQFVVRRQPALGEQAWELAGQIKAVGGSLQMDRWILALALTRSDAWFLHDRP